MPVFQALEDLGLMFNTLSESPIILNFLPNSTEADKEYLDRTITTSYTDDMISMLPSCPCGKTKGAAHIGRTKGPENIPETCIYCHKPIKSAFDDDVKPIVWFRRPEGVQQLLNPMVWNWLRHRFTKSGFSILQWLTDPDYRPKVKQPLVIGKLIQMGYKRNYNAFVENFDEILAFLFSLRDFKLKTAGTFDALQECIRLDRDIIFSDYLPIPNKSFLVTENTNMGIFIDNVAMQAKDAILALASIDKDFYDQDPRVKQNRTARALNKLAEYHEKYIRDNLSPKPGQLRRHVYGTRVIFSFRHVITSIEGQHKYTDLHAPWSVGLTTFRPHVINKLMNRGFSLNGAIGLIMSKIDAYDPLLDEILQELIAETLGGLGFLTSCQRNF